MAATGDKPAVLRWDPREHVSGAGALHPDCIYGGTEGSPCKGRQFAEAKTD
jgi:hypothetical protein